MTTEIRDGRYMVGLWFLQGFDMDWMGVLWRDEGRPFVFDYRFRTYRDNLIGDESRDEKQFFRVSFLDGDAEKFCVEVIAKMTEQLLRSGFSVDDVLVHVPIKSDRAEQILSLLSTLPQAHVRSSPTRGESVSTAN